MENNGRNTIIKHLISALNLCLILFCKAPSVYMLIVLFHAEFRAGGQKGTDLTCDASSAAFKDAIQFNASIQRAT